MSVALFGYCGGLRIVSLFVNRSAIFAEAVFKVAQNSFQHFPRRRF